VSPCPLGLKEVSWMTWEAPSFVEVKMDAEVNSYQEDYEGI
jgi:coenzyme PQQ precursor peptide PqqA